MSVGRPPLDIGTHGDITVNVLPSGKYQALCRYRDLDGATRRVTASGRTKKDARNALTRKLKERSRGHEDVLTRDSKVSDLARVWLEHHEASDGSRELYQGSIDRHIIPKIGALRVHEVTTPRADKFLERVGSPHPGGHLKADGTPVMIGGPTAAKTARVVLTQMMSMAVRYGLLDVNPVREARTPSAQRKTTRALSSDELRSLLEHVQEWVESGTSGPARDQDIVDMIEVMVGTGIRPGEVLALRFSDGVNLGATPSITITGTVKRTKAQGLHRQDAPKTQDSERELRIPPFVAQILRARKLQSGGNDLVFPNRNGDLREPANLNRVWRQARGEEWAWVTPKSFRAAVATIIDREADSQHAASQLGHTSDAVTLKHYIARDRTAADNSDILERFRDAR